MFFRTLIELPTVLTESLSNIDVYVGDDKKIHFVDKDGADTALNFSSFDVSKVSSLTFSTYGVGYVATCGAVEKLSIQSVSSGYTAFVYGYKDGVKTTIGSASYNVYTTFNVKDYDYIEISNPSLGTFRSNYKYVE